MAFGGTIKLKGESAYRSALKNINQSLREVNSAMKVVTSEFDKNDKSVEALSRKQDVLKQKLEAQKQKLSLVTSQYQKYKEAVEKSASEHTQLGAKLDSAKNKLQSIKATLGESSSAYQKQKQVVDQLQKEYDESTQAQDKNKQSLSKLAVQMNNAQADVNKTARQVDELGDQMEEAKRPTDELGNSMKDAEKPSKDLGEAVEDAGDKAEKAGHGGFTVLKGAIANLASNVIQSAIDGIRGLASEAVESSDAMKKFEQTMKFAGFDDSQIKRASSSMKEYADKTVYDLTTVSNTTAQLASNGVPNFEKLTEAAGNLNAVAGGNQDTFKSVAMVLTQTAGAGKLTTENWNQLADAVPGASGKLQEAMKKNGAYTGNFRDAMAKGQITADEFNKAIMDLGFTDVAQKAATSTSTFEGAMGNLQASVVDGLMKIYDTIGSENITGFINGITNTIETVIPPIKNTINWLVTNLPRIAPLLAGIATGLAALMVAQQIESMVAAFNAWKVATEGLTVAQRILNAVQLSSPVGAILAGVLALVAGITVLWNTNKGFRDFVTNAWNGIKNTIVSVATSIGNFFTQTIPNAFNSAKTAISAWFTNVGSTLSKLPGAFATWLGSALNNIKTWAVNVATNASNAGRQFLNNVVNFVKNLPYNLGYILGTVIGTVVKFASNMATNATKAGRQFLTNVVNFVKQLPGRIASFLSNVVSRVTSWASSMASKATSAGSRFLNNVVNFVKQLPGRIASFLSHAIAKVTSWASSMASKASSAGSRFLNNVVRFVSQLPGRIASFLSSVISRLGAWAGQMASAGARGARSMFNAVVNGLASLPGQVASIGSNIVHGIWNGISGAAGWLAGQVRSFARGILDGMKSALGIHSPSRVMRDQVGVNIAKGVVAGVKKEQKNTIKELNKATSETLGKWYKKRNELQSEYEKATSAKSRASIKKRIASVNDSIAEAEKKGNAKVLALRAKYDKALLSSARSRASELSKAGKLSASAEVSYWEKIAKSCHKGTAAYNSAIAKVNQAKKSLNTDVDKLTKTYNSGIEKASADLDKKISELEKTYSDTVNKRRDEIASSLDLFSGVKLDKWFDKDELAENLQDQVNNLNNWNDTLNSLEKRLGANNPLYQELTKMGVSQIDTLKQLNSMSDEELKHYNDLYSQKRAISMQRATEENKSLRAQTDKSIAEAKASTNKQINTLQANYMNGLKKLGVKLNKQGLNIGKNIVSGLNVGVNKGISSIIPKVEKQVGKLVKAIKKKLKIHSPSQVMRDEVGKYMAQGIGVGFEQEMQAVTQQMNDSLPTSFDTQNPTLGATEAGITDGLTMIDLVDSFKQALSEMKIELDDEVAGKFVNRTVAKTIYR